MPFPSVLLDKGYSKSEMIPVWITLLSRFIARRACHLLGHHGSDQLILLLPTCCVCPNCSSFSQGFFLPSCVAIAFIFSTHLRNDLVCPWRKLEALNGYANGDRNILRLISLGSSMASATRKKWIRPKNYQGENLAGGSSVVGTNPGQEVLVVLFCLHCMSGIQLQKE